MSVNTTCGCETPKSCACGNDECGSGVCGYQTELGLDQNASYSVALKKVLSSSGCEPSTTCGGATMPLDVFVQKAVFSLFAPFIDVNQVDHGFEITDCPVPVYQDQANPGQWLKALDGVSQAEAIIIDVADSDNYRVASTPGFYKIDHNLDSAEIYYLSATAAGEVSTTPSTQAVFNAVNQSVLQYL